MHKLHRLYHLHSFIPKLRPPKPFPFLKAPLIPSNPTFTHPSKAFFSSDSDSDSFQNPNKFGQGPPPNVISHPSARQPAAKNSVFVSKYYEISNNEIFQFLDSMKLEYRIRSTGQIITKCCPFCDKPHHNKPDNLWTLNIKPNSGTFLCFRCGTRGSWFDFKSLVLGNGRQLNAEIEVPSGTYEAQNKKIANAQAQEPKLASESVAYLRLQSLLLNDFPDINQYLTGNRPEERHLSLETLEKYKVGVGYETFLDSNGEQVELPCVYFPMYANKKDKSIKISNRGNVKEQESPEKPEKQAINLDSEGNEMPVIEINDANNVLVRTKIRAILKKNKGYQRMEPAPGYWGLFGLNTVPAKAKSVVLTEGEYDAMAVYEATKMPAISLPNGANHLPLQVLPWLERFERIYLWMDADEVGQANAVNFAQKLGSGRVFIVNTKRYDPQGPKDANDALRKDPSSIQRYINEAKTITRENITTFSEMKYQILNKILRFEENTGVKSQYFRWFNTKIKGFRRGEMTILTGPTGSGKTSLLSQLSLDFANQGISTLWGSFEVKNDMLLTNMLLQYAGVNLYKEPNKFEYHAQHFEKLPLYFLKYFGSNEIDKVLQTIDYAIYAYDIGHIIIDNLQFLLSGQGKGFERFDLQDEAIFKLRNLATTKNVHVTLVIHPKKVDDTQDLTISSVFGSAKATQEADNIIILQNRPKYRLVDIKKNRFDGDVGKIPLGFERDSKRFFELKEGEIFTLHRTQDSIKEVIENRRSRNMLDQLSEAVHSEKSVQEANQDAVKHIEEELYEEKIVMAPEKNNSVSSYKEEPRKAKKEVVMEIMEEGGDGLGIDAAEFLESKIHENNDPEASLQDFAPSMEPEVMETLFEDSLPSYTVKSERTDVGENKVSEQESENLTTAAAEVETEPVVEEEKVQPEVVEEKKEERKKRKKEEGLYSKMYDFQKEQVKQKDSFYNEDDRQAVRENMEFLENEKKNRAKQFQKKKPRNMDLFEAELMEANRALEEKNGRNGK